MSYRPTNDGYIIVDRELNQIINIVSKHYDIPIHELFELKNRLDKQCIANIWNTGNPIRCSRKRMNDCYCRVHQTQIDKSNNLKYGHYDGTQYSIKTEFNEDDYNCLECDTILHNENEYYIDKEKNIYKMIDKEHSIVDTIEDDIKNILLEYIYN
tara:strand:+ start:31 stop:495 length:465 start_codon:yes stop_codon:yes gene_type:complete